MTPGRGAQCSDPASLLPRRLDRDFHVLPERYECQEHVWRLPNLVSELRLE